MVIVIVSGQIQYYFHCLKFGAILAFANIFFFKLVELFRIDVQISFSNNNLLRTFIIWLQHKSYFIVDASFIYIFAACCFTIDCLNYEDPPKACDYLTYIDSLNWQSDRKIDESFVERLVCFGLLKERVWWTNVRNIDVIFVVHFFLSNNCSWPK